MATEPIINDDPAALAVDPGKLDSVSNAQYYNPHEVLGAHIDQKAGTVTFRLLRPLAKSVTILTQNGEYEASHEHNGVFVALAPASEVNGHLAVPDYRVRTMWADGRSLVEDDPYRYLPMIGVRRISNTLATSSASTMSRTPTFFAFSTGTLMTSPSDDSTDS